MKVAEFPCQCDRWRIPKRNQTGGQLATRWFVGQSEINGQSIGDKSRFHSLARRRFAAADEPPG